MRLSVKRKKGKATGMHSPHAGSGAKGWIKDRTASEHRRREREFEREVIKAYRGSASELPADPHPTDGGYYAT